VLSKKRLRGGLADDLLSLKWGVRLPFARLASIPRRLLASWDWNCRAGDHDDALLFACGANASHGLPRSNEDKRKAVLLLLKSEKWSRWSDREIARRCKVSPPLVAKLRNGHLQILTDAGQKDEAACLSPTDAPAVASDRRRKVTRAGKSFIMKTAAIGSQPARARSRRNGESEPRLRSFDWSEAPKSERAKFADAVGMHEYVDAFKMKTPGFDVLSWAWKVSGHPERQSFAKEHREEINALASLGTPLAANRSEAPTETRREKRGTLNELAKRAGRVQTAY
jgi:hypothetical protein